MPSIQCAIELYDGVSPVLSEMALSLDSFSGEFTRFAEEMGTLAPDIEGLSLFGGALSDLAAEAADAYGVMSALLEVGEGMLNLFSEDIFAPLTQGAAYATAEIKDQFSTLHDHVTKTFDSIGRHALGVAAGLPGSFAGPLAQISQMFHSAAASARSALSSITSSASAAISAASRVSSASAAIPRLQSASNARTVSPFGMPSREALTLPDPEVLWQNGKAPITPNQTVTVNIQNENHIAGQVDVETVLREMEVRLCDAVASSIEGVYP